jgi:hypothetical protein
MLLLISPLVVVVVAVLPLPSLAVLRLVHSGSYLERIINVCYHAQSMSTDTGVRGVRGVRGVSDVRTMAVVPMAYSDVEMDGDEDIDTSEYYNCKAQIEKNINQHHDSTIWDTKSSGNGWRNVPSVLLNSNHGALAQMQGSGGGGGVDGLESCDARPAPPRSALGVVRPHTEQWRAPQKRRSSGVEQQQQQKRRSRRRVVATQESGELVCYERADC